MIDAILLQLMLFLHAITWLVVQFGALFHPTIAKFNILYLFPIIYLSYVIFNDCILNGFEEKLVGKKDVVNPYKIDTYTDKIYEFNKNLFKYSYQNPLTAQGMLLIGFIISLYSLKYIWKEIE